MTADCRLKAEYLLQKELTRFGSDIIFDHPWASEESRWSELIFSLLCELSDLPQYVIRDLTERLESLDLLHISDLAALTGTVINTDMDDPNGQHILDLLIEEGFDHGSAVNALTMVSKAAAGIDRKFNGKIQRYLRHYGELMLDDAQELFNFDPKNSQLGRRVLTYWLQNVLNMPLSLEDENVRAYCNANQLEVADIIEAADRLDLNLALLDDLLLAANEASVNASE